MDAPTGRPAAFDSESDFPPSSTAFYTLFLLFMAYVFSFVDRSVLSLLVGPIREEFGLSDFEFSLLHGAAFASLYCVVSIPLGVLADRVSRRRIVAVSVLFWSLMTCLCGLARTAPQLVVARMGVGAGEAGLTPPAYSIILDSFPPRSVGFAMAFYKLGVMVGGGLALIVGGALFDYFVELGGIELPILGRLAPWQATFLSIGAPGFILAGLLISIHEPTRKGVARSEDQTELTALPMKTVVRFLWERRRTYGSLFLGSSLLAVAGFGTTAWYPEFLVRSYGLSKADAGAAYGTIYLVGGMFGVFAGPLLVRVLERRGYADANVRAILITSLATVIPGTLAPLAGSLTMTLALAAPATFLGSTYLGVMALSFQQITPNQMRGQTTAVYILVTSIAGMAFGTSILAAFTDFVFGDDGALNLSLATLSAIFYPMASLLFWFCLPAYRESVREAGNWDLGRTAK
jgi:MFS family permease